MIKSLSFFAAAALLLLCQAPGATAKTHDPSFKDCSDCPEMVTIPTGNFMMGESRDKELRFGAPESSVGRSEPVHKVTFTKPFALGKYPITVAQFRKFVEETGYDTGDSCVNQRMVERHMVYELARGFNWRSPGIPQDDRHPVVCVSWDDAMAYTAWLSQKTGKHYTLPNEAQYEYATRAGTTTMFFWSDVADATACLYSNQPDLDQAAAFGPLAPKDPKYRFPCSDGYGYTSPVGSYRPNPWGLYDMQGNIWEYVLDCLNPDYKGAPTDGSAWMTGDCDAHPARGGSNGNAAFTAYLAMRAPRDADYRGHSWGFRIARID